MAKTKAQMAADKAARTAGKPGTAVAPRPISTAVAGVGRLPEGIKLVRHVTLPVLVLKEPNKTHYLNIVDAIRISAIEGKKDKDGKKEKPADICTVGDVQSGEMFTLLVPAVVKSNLERGYAPASPGDAPAYIGKVFALTNKGKRTTTQRYFDFEITEVDASGLTAQAQAAK